LGLDSNLGTATSSPLETITKAYSKAVAGDTIYLFAETYREVVALVSKSGTVNKYITLKA
jgi:hypothetical protein